MSVAHHLARIATTPVPAEDGGDAERARRIRQAAIIAWSCGVGTHASDVAAVVVLTAADHHNQFSDRMVGHLATRLRWLGDPTPDFAVCVACGGTVEGARHALALDDAHCPGCDRRTSLTLPEPVMA